MALKTMWNTKSETWVRVPEHWIDHPIFGADLAPEKPGAATSRPTKKKEN